MIDTSLKTYGEDVFSEKAIRDFLPKAVATKLIATMKESKPLDPSIADEVAHGMKRVYNWAEIEAEVEKIAARMQTQ